MSHQDMASSGRPTTVMRKRESASLLSSVIYPSYSVARAPEMMFIN